MSTENLFHCKYDPEAIQELREELNQIRQIAIQGSVKKVQRGLTSSPANVEMTIDIEPVNPEKCHVTILTAKNPAAGAYVRLLTEDKLTVGLATSLVFSWEIVEYY